MALKKDMRRGDLVVPYIEPATKRNETDMQGTLASTLPMAAMFTRSKMIGWTAVILSTQSWLSESPDAKKNASTPSILSVGMSVLSLGVSYMHLFMPPVQGKPGSGSGTEAPAAVPI